MGERGKGNREKNIKEKFSARFSVALRSLAGFMLWRVHSELQRDTKTLGRGEGREERDAGLV